MCRGIIEPEAFVGQRTRTFSRARCSISFQDVRTICIWRRLEVRDMLHSFVGTLLLFPWLFAIVCGPLIPLVGTDTNIRFYLAAIPLLVILARWLYRDFYIKKHGIRIVSKESSIEFRFDAPTHERQRFFDEALLSIGYDPSKFEIP